MSLKALVCVKTIEQLVDEVEFSPDGLDIVRDDIETAANEWDLAAVEEALRLREKFGGDVTVVTCGDSTAEKGLRRALAMGADQGIRIDTAARDPLSVAHALATLVRSEQPDAVLCGVQSADSGQAAVGTMLAALAGLPCATVVSRLEYDDQSRRFWIDRELEGGAIARMEVDGPALLTIQTGISRPRYANLRAIKLAEAATVRVCTASPPPAQAFAVRRLFPPAVGRRARLLEGDPSSIAQQLSELVRGLVG